LDKSIAVPVWKSNSHYRLLIVVVSGVTECVWIIEVQPAVAAALVLTFEMLNLTGNATVSISASSASNADIVGRFTG